MNVTIERNLDLYQISRDGYTILDWISDIGGIQGILISAVGIVVGYWNYNILESYMVTKLFRMEKKDSSNKVYSDPADKYETFQVSVFSGLRDVICDSLPSCLQCCRNSRNDRGMEIGRANLEKESNIITILQSRRYVNAALKRLLSKRERQILKDQTKFWNINVDAQKSKKDMGSDSEAESSNSIRSSQIDFGGEGPSPSNPGSKYMKKNVSGT